jgi:7-carboxy-7-deazaguanine synthase
MTIEEILARVSKVRGEVKHAVLTGGEPMLFGALVPLAERLRAEGFVITVETAGTVWQDLPCDLMSISPKLKNSVPAGDAAWSTRHDLTRYNLEVLEALVTNYAYQLKFVVTDPVSESGEIEQIIAELPPLDPSRILLMPEGTDVETLKTRTPQVEAWARNRGWGVSPRLHIEMFGNKRGT